MEIMVSDVERILTKQQQRTRQYNAGAQLFLQAGMHRLSCWTYYWRESKFYSSACAFQPGERVALQLCTVASDCTAHERACTWAS